jgi:competence protein ComFC
VPPGIVRTFSVWPKENGGVFFASESCVLSDCKYCLQCGELVENQQNELCISCLVLELPIRRIRSLWYYEGSVAKLVRKFKYNIDSGLADFFAKKLLLAAKSRDFWQFPTGTPKWDLIIPMPSAIQRLRKRRFAHVWFAVKILAKELGIETFADILKMKVTRTSQAGLSRMERAANSREKFLLDTSKIKFKRVLLVDDVVTTGSTAIYGAEKLMSSGASSVDVLTISRSVRFHDNLRWHAAQLVAKT